MIRPMMERPSRVSWLTRYLLTPAAAIAPTIVATPTTAAQMRRVVVQNPGCSAFRFSGAATNVVARYLRQLEGAHQFSANLEIPDDPVHEQR